MVAFPEKEEAPPCGTGRAGVHSHGGWASQLASGDSGASLSTPRRREALTRLLLPGFLPSLCFPRGASLKSRWGGLRGVSVEASGFFADDEL